MTLAVRCFIYASRQRRNCIDMRMSVVGGKHNKCFVSRIRAYVWCGRLVNMGSCSGLAFAFSVCVKTKYQDATNMQQNIQTNMQQISATSEKTNNKHATNFGHVGTTNKHKQHTNYTQTCYKMFFALLLHVCSLFVRGKTG